MEERSPKTRWTLDKSGLESLLNAFHSDREQASHAYEALRGRLIRFFEWNHADSPAELADETLDRLARRLSVNDGDVSDPVKFASGIARLLLKEHWREKYRKEEALAEMSRWHRDADQERELLPWEENAAVLEECLRSIPESSRILILRYFSAESRARIEQRQRLAEEHGISTNALRNRVMRIRMELEKNFLSLQNEKKFPERKMNH